METAATYCSQCDCRLGTLINLWTQIGKRYISPVVQLTNVLDVSPEGAIQHGEGGTIVDSCRVQRVVCSQCRSALGSKCLSSTVNHVLYEGQLLLRTSSIQLKSLDGYRSIQPSIQRVLDLKAPPANEAWPEGHSQDKDHNSSSSETDNNRPTTNNNPKLKSLLDEVNTQKEEIDRLNEVGYQVVAAFNQAVHRIDEDVRRLKSETYNMTKNLTDHHTRIKGLPGDILTARAEINEIKVQLQSFTTQDHPGQESSSIRNAIAQADASLRIEFSNKWEIHHQRLNLLESKLESARRDLKTLRESADNARNSTKAALSATDGNAREIVALKAELQQLRQELAIKRSYNPSSSNPIFATQELDILTSSITKIGHRTSQIETLQMEFELLKGRVQRMEAETTTTQRGLPINLQQEIHHSQLVSSKRIASLPRQVEDSTSSTFPSSIIPRASDMHISEALTVHANASQLLPPSKARRTSSRASIPKLTKSGAVDKRTLKKRNLKSATKVRKVKD